jgi:NADH pyrophosphatase NudC (nudix superfamily)
MISIPTQSFAGNPLIRFDERRKDENYLMECLRDTNKPCAIILTLLVRQTWKILTEAHDNNPLKTVYFDLNSVLAATNAKDVSDLLKFTCVLLGKKKDDGQSVITISLTESFAAQVLKYQSEKTSKLYSFEDGRSLLTKLSSKPDLAIAGLAIAMASWHAANEFDGRSGASTQPTECGMKRKAIPRVGSMDREAPKLYPRIDPVMIACVVSPDGKHCLLGKMKKMPQGFFSCLSGFIEVLPLGTHLHVNLTC